MLHQGQEAQKGETHRNTSEARQEWQHSLLLCAGPARGAKFSASLIQRLTAGGRADRGEEVGLKMLHVSLQEDLLSHLCMQVTETLERPCS